MPHEHESEERGAQDQNARGQRYRQHHRTVDLTKYCWLARLGGDGGPRAWTALLVCVLALGVAVWVFFRKTSLFDSRELSGFPSGLVVPVRESVNRVTSKYGSSVTRMYNENKTKYDAQLAEMLAKHEGRVAGEMSVSKDVVDDFMRFDFLIF